MSVAAVLLLAALGASGAAAQTETISNGIDPVPGLVDQLSGLRDAAVRLPLAAVLGAALAFRPRRRGTPPRTAAVIQTQILLAIVGAIVMLIVGQSLARAFGIVGVASLVRYRAKIDDPKDAGVMLASLGIGLASGVGLYFIAAFAAAFLLGFLWWVESIEPKAVKRFHLKVKTPDPDGLRAQLEAVLRVHRATFELRSLSTEEISFEVQLPFDRSTDAISGAIAALNGGAMSVEWDDKKAA
jgi:uncharacterized membrane protein YhiD involved in acid resistance